MHQDWLKICIVDRDLRSKIWSYFPNCFKLDLWRNRKNGGSKSVPRVGGVIVLKLDHCSQRTCQYKVPSLPNLFNFLHYRKLMLYILWCLTKASSWFGLEHGICIMMIISYSWRPVNRLTQAVGITEKETAWTALMGNLVLRHVTQQWILCVKWKATVCDESTKYILVL